MRKGSGFWLYGVKKDLDVVRIALIVYKGALLSVLHVSSSRNNLLLRLADGKDGSPMGVVRRGGVHIVCSTEAQWN